MKWAVIIVVLAGLGLATGHYLRGGHGASADTVATYTVTKQKFERRVTAEGNLRAVKATQVTAPPAQGVMKIAWLAPDGQLVKKGDVLVKFDPSDPEKQLAAGQSDLAAADAKLAEQAVKSKTDEQNRQADAELAADELDEQKKFQNKDEQVFSRNQIIESQIDEGLAQAKQQHAEQSKQVEKKVASSNAAVIAVEKQKAQIAIAHAKSALESMQVVAPHDGIFVLRRDWRGELPKLGTQVWPGRPMGDIPLLDTMEAEVFVLEVDGSGLAEKQPAEVIIEARPDITYKGHIRMVEKLAQPRQPGSPVQYFAVVIELDKTDKDVMKPGQRVKATLVLDQEDAIVVPRQAVIDREGKNLVYKKGPNGWTAVPVELGPATSGRIVIKTGLTAGDVIALRDPTHTDTGSGSDAGSGGAK